MRMRLSLFAVLGLAACTAPASKSADNAQAVPRQAPSGVMTEEQGRPYIDGLVTPVIQDERSLHEQDLERIGRRP